MQRRTMKQVKDAGYRVEQNGNQYKVYQYDADAKAYIFYGYYQTRQELFTDLLGGR